MTLGHGGVAAGTIVRPVYFRNRSGRACFVFGYAGFGLEDASHRPQPSHVNWGPGFGVHTGPHRVVLRPGERAETVLAWGDNPSPGESQSYPCEPKSAWLEVTPPDERTFVRLRFSEVVCEHGTLNSPALHRAGR